MRDSKLLLRHVPHAFSRKEFVSAHVRSGLIGIFIVAWLLAVSGCRTEQPHSHATFIEGQKTNLSSISACEAWGSHPFGELWVKIKRKGGGATVTVYNRQGVFLSQRTFAQEEFEAVGGYSGLWIPAVQPLTNALLISKFGAYAGRTLLVLQDGRLLEFAGGFYYWDPAANRLFLLEDTDMDGLITVLDADLKVICASSRPQDLYDDTGHPISAPNEFSFIRLPELASEQKAEK